MSAVRPDRITSISARFDLYPDAMGEDARDFTADELAIVARYWDHLGRTVERRQSDTPTQDARHAREKPT
jgi:hypothetical protein